MKEMTCDNCDCQEGRHYCLLHGKFFKNMDIYVCSDWIEKEDNMRRLFMRIIAKIHPSGLRYDVTRKTIIYAPWWPRGYRKEEI